MASTDESSGDTPAVEAVDAIEVAVVAQSLGGIVQEMQNSLFCTGYSTIIRESRDASCAILDPDGRVLAQHTVLPLHLGAFPACAAGLLDVYPASSLAEGDAFAVNHPYLGGSPHATDVAVLSPILVDGALFGFAGSIAHKSDLGGLVPGTNSGQAREVFHEGLLLPPVRFYAAGEPIPEVEAIIRANSRTPDLVAGDLRGQVGATRLGAERVRALCRKLGAGAVRAAGGRLFAQTERRARAAIAGWPDGTYAGEAVLHNDGIEGGRPVRIRVGVTIDGDRIHFDFRGSDDQAAGPYNIRPPLVRAVCTYALTCLVGPDLPSNAGLARVVEAAFRPGSLLDPLPPAPVNTYMPVAVATAEAVFDALGQAVPRGRGGESSSGSAMGTLSHSRTQAGYPQVQYELPAGAIGARFDRDGVSASTAHVANGGATSVEILESEFPIEMERFELVRDSGGAGRWRGGLAYVRSYRASAETMFSPRNGKQLSPSRGRESGQPGRSARIVVNPGRSDEIEVTGTTGNVRLQPGDVIEIAQPGAGGFGDPRTRPADLVLRDVRDGYVSVEAARDVYGVALARSGRAWKIDEEATTLLRDGAGANGSIGGANDGA